MALFHYTQSAAGIPAGTTKYLPDSLAAEMVRQGFGRIVPKQAVPAPSKSAPDKVITPAVEAAKTAPKRAKKQSK